MSALAFVDDPLWRRVARAVVRRDARRTAVHEWSRTLTGEPALPAGPITHVAVVCTGNVCRSPFAAALLASRVESVRVASFGIAAADGHAADPRAIALAPRYRVDLAAHRTRRLGRVHAHDADLLLVMEPSHAAAIAVLWPVAAPRVRLLGDFLPARPFAIPDPWDRDERLWLDVYARIDAAVARLADRLHAARAGDRA